MLRTFFTLALLATVALSQTAGNGTHDPAGSGPRVDIDDSSVIALADGDKVGAKARPGTTFDGTVADGVWYQLIGTYTKNGKTETFTVWSKFHVPQQGDQYSEVTLLADEVNEPGGGWERTGDIELKIFDAGGFFIQTYPFVTWTP